MERRQYGGAARNRWFSLLAIPCLGLQAELFASDGSNLELRVDESGCVAALIVGERDVHDEKAGPRSGFSVVEFPGEKVHKVGGSIRTTSSGFRQTATVEEAQLALETRYEDLDEFMTISGTISDLSGEDRAVDLLFQLPVDVAGGRWWGDINRWSEIQNGLRYGTIVEDFPSQNPGYAIDVIGQGRETDFTSIYPVACVTDRQSRFGLALAIDADSPVVHSCEYDASERMFLIRLRLGLTARAKPHLRSKAPFCFHVYSVNPRWGYRDALARYYRIHPGTFTRRAKQDGILLEQSVSDEREGNPDWNAEYFSYCRTFEHRTRTEPIRHALGIGSYLYVLPGQQSLTGLPSLPEDHDQAVQLLKAYKEPEEAQPVRHSNKRQRIQAAATQDAIGQYQVRIWETFWSGNSIAFPINPDPDLFVDQPVGSRTYTSDLYEHCRSILEENPTFGGIYTDSYHSWGTYYNYRQDHFPYADFPLTHDAEGRVCILNSMSHLEWNLGLRALAGEYDDLTAGNGIRPGQMFNAFACDVLHVEDSVWDNFPWARAVSYHKPFHISLEGDKSRPVVESFLKNCAVYGLLPTRVDPDSRLSYPSQYEDLMETYIPVIRQASALGWEPVPYATSSDTEVQVERFGPRDGLMMLTVLNHADSRKSVTVTIDEGTISVRPDTPIRALIRRKEMNARDPWRSEVAPKSLEVLLIATR